MSTESSTIDCPPRSDFGGRTASGIAAFAILCIGLAFWGAVPVADHMTHRVLFRVDGVPWSQWWGPFQMPAPMNAWGVRPFSVLLLKTYSEVWGPAQIPPTWLLVAKSALSMFLFGLASASWLRVQGLGRWALPAMFSTALLAPSLFTSWYLPELDNLGAAALLWGCAQLSREGSLGRMRGAVVGALLFGVFLKESSGILALGLFSAGALIHWTAGHRLRLRRHLWGFGMTLGGWILLSAQLMLTRESMASQESFLGKFQVIEHNSAQLVYLVSGAGVFLLALGSWLPRLPKRARPWTLAAPVVLLIGGPMLTFYSHYEAVYYSPRFYVLGLSALLWSALLLTSLPLLKRLRSGVLCPPVQVGQAWCALSIISTIGAITLAVVLAPTAREDMASRIFIILAPMLHALAFQGAASAWSLVAPHGRRLAKACCGIMLVSMGWYPIASAVNFGLEWRAMQPLDMEGRSQMVAQGIQERVILFNHYVQWMGHYEMRALGAPASVEANTHFTQVYAWLEEEALPDTDWGLGMLALEEGHSLNVPMNLYWMASRSQMSETANTVLEGDLSWTRRPVGLFMPINWAPEEQAAEQTEGMPEHNRPEDLRRTRYHTGDTPLQTLARARGQSRWSRVESYVQLPQNLLEIPRRLISGVPFVERYQYEAEYFELGPREEEETGEVSDILTEQDPMMPPEGHHEPPPPESHHQKGGRHHHPQAPGPHPGEIELQ